MISAVSSRAGLGALLLFVAAGVTFREVSNLRLGTPDGMGPGYFPAILGALFILFGLMLAVEAWKRPDERVDVGRVRPVLFLLGSIVLFGLLYPFVGGAISIAALVVVAALAEDRRSVRELAGLSVAVVALIWIVFVWILDLQLNMLPAVVLQ